MFVVSKMDLLFYKVPLIDHSDCQLLLIVKIQALVVGLYFFDAEESLEVQEASEGL